jgi:arylsulfatase A-like enzyme
VLETVRELDLQSRTLVLFTSDNGGTRRGLNTPLRGHKGSTWEGGMRVCTIAWWPGQIPAGTETDAITGMIDVLPTIVKLAGGQLPSDRRLDGGDIWPLLAGKPGARSPHDSFYYYRGLKLEAVRHNQWKLRLANAELYDLANDIGESTNVAHQHPAIVQKLQAVAARMQGDLNLDGIGPGCRPLGKVEDAQPIIGRDGAVREEFRGPDRL